MSCYATWRNGVLFGLPPPDNDNVLVAVRPTWTDGLDFGLNRCGLCGRMSLHTHPNIDATVLSCPICERGRVKPMGGGQFMYDARPDPNAPLWSRPKRKKGSGK